jgi:transposase-like protein
MNEEQRVTDQLPEAAERVEAESVKPKPRRRHSAQFRQRVIEEASRPGVRVASVARAHDLDVGLVRRWIANASARERLHAHAQAARQRLRGSGRVLAELLFARDELSISRIRAGACTAATDIRLVQQCPKADPAIAYLMGAGPASSARIASVAQGAKFQG